MAEKDERAASAAKLAELIEGIGVAMLTTVARDGSLHSRPMMTQGGGFDGTLWFLTRPDTAKAEEIAEHREVNLAYADPGGHRYVSMSGLGSIVRDARKAKELWSPAHGAWFPGGVEDPDLALLRVDVEVAEYWDASSGRMVTLAGFVKTAASGRRFDGRREDVTLDTSGN